MREASLEPVLHTVQSVHGYGIDHGYLAFVVLEHKHQIDILHVELENESEAQLEEQHKATCTKSVHTVLDTLYNLLRTTNMLTTEHTSTGNCMQQ